MKLFRGFSLVEILVVMAIIALLSGALALNFRTAGTNTTARSQVANSVVSDVRRMQSMALAGSGFSGKAVCGYGINYFNPTRYILFARPIGSTSCNSDARPRTYQATIDVIIERVALRNPNFVFDSPFPDIFFELPNPTTYINGNPLVSQSPAVIAVALLQPSGPPEKTTIYIFANGKIDITDQ